MGNLSKYKLDRNKVENGIWVTYADDLQCLIARSNSQRVRDFALKSRRRFESRFPSGKPNSEASEAIAKEVAANAVLLDWRNFQNDDGTPLPFSPEKALEYFNDPSYQPFYEWVVNISESQNRYYIDREEDDLGN